MMTQHSRGREQEIQQREQAATKGPWRWNLNLKSKEVRLEAVIGGFEVVMDFVRWGMGGAKVRFQRDGLMVDAETCAEVVPARSHHSHWFQTLRHRDADFIAHAREDIPYLLAALDQARQERDAARAAFEDASTTGIEDGRQEPEGDRPSYWFNQVCAALGLFDGARPVSPRVVLWDEVLPTIAALKANNAEAAVLITENQHVYELWRDALKRLCGQRLESEERTMAAAHAAILREMHAPAELIAFADALAAKAVRKT